MGKGVLWVGLAAALFAGCFLKPEGLERPACTGNETVARPHLIFIDIDNHALAGLWTANAPNLKALIRNGTLAYSRVVLPSRSNANNFALLTGQFPDGHAVPGNSWLMRDADFKQPIDILDVELGSYSLYDMNPLRVRSDGLYRLATRAGMQSAFVGQLPTLEVGADQVHLTSIGMTIQGHTLDRLSTLGILAGLHYPLSKIRQYAIDGPPSAGESSAHFVMRDAAAFVRGTCAERPLPQVMFVWDLLDYDNSDTLSDNQAAIEDYDEGLGQLIAALSERDQLGATNIILTLDQGRADVHKQAALGTRGGTEADGQLGQLVSAEGASVGISPSDYEILNDEGAAFIYARTAGAGTAAGQTRQRDVSHALLSLIQSGKLQGIDTGRTMTFDGAQGTRRFIDYRISCPNQADIIVYPQDDWVLSQVDPGNVTPGALQSQAAYSRHGGLAIDEIYVPVIMYGPAFKQGALLPHLMSHPDVAATAARTLQAGQLQGAAGAAIRAAFRDDPGEVQSQPDDLSTSREVVLGAGGLWGPIKPTGKLATSAILIDVAGLYFDEIFTDSATADAAAPLRQLASRGTVFERFWTRSRDWPVTEYEFLAGALPATDDWPSFAEADPAVKALAPGLGLIKVPAVAGFIADSAAYADWRQTRSFTRAGLFEAAKQRGLQTALVGQLDFHALHVDPTAIDRVQKTADVPALVKEILAAPTGSLIVVALGSARTGDRHAQAARDELNTLAKQIAAVVEAAPDALVAITSRGATVIDDTAADFYGAESSRHVPLIFLGPAVRSQVVTSEPGGPSDIPATLLYGLGAATQTDIVDGTVPINPDSGTAIFRPGASRVLVRAF
jgi:hypothetical protein